MRLIITPSSHPRQSDLGPMCEIISCKEEMIQNRSPPLKDRGSYGAGPGNGGTSGGDGKGIEKGEEKKILYYNCLTPHCGYFMALFPEGAP